MADDEYNKKLASLQQYIPFLDGMIAQLKDPSKKNREQQLSKMESLHAMITDRRKKLKLETLNKCEDVISKLYSKVNHKSINQLKGESTISSPRSTPASPSPPRLTSTGNSEPLTIPTERLTPLPHISRIDVYSSAAESLNKPRPQHVSPKFPDMSKPPISLADLKDLEEDVHEKINERASLTELNNIRNKIAHELIMENIKSLSPSSKKSRSAATSEAENNLSLDDDWAVNDVKSNDSPISTASTLDLCSPRIQLHVKPKSSPSNSKESSSIFGSIISGQVLEGKIKKDERRSSLTKEDKTVKCDRKSDDKLEETVHQDTREKKSPSATKDEQSVAGEDKSKARRHSKDRKKSESKKEKSKGKDHRHSSGKKEHENKHPDKLSDDVNEGSTASKDEKLKLKEGKSNDKKNKKSSSSHKHSKSEHKIEDKDNKKEERKKENVVAEGVIVLKDKPDVVPEVTIEKSIVQPKAVENNKESVPVFRRLADKYNKKPKKLAVTDVVKAVSESIEANMIKSPPKIPIINRLTEPPPPPPASLVKCSQAEPELPSVLQTLMDQLRKSNQEYRQPNPPQPPPLLSPNPHNRPLPNPPLRTPPLLPNPPLLQNPALLPNPSPAALLSPTDNFISEYVREEYLNNRNQMWPERMRFEPNPAIPTNNRFEPNPAIPTNNRFEPNPAIPTNNRFIPPLLNPRFEAPTYNAYNQTDAIAPDYYPSNNANPYNAGPPLLSPEMPHYHEPKPSSFAPNIHEQYEDARWRPDDNRPPWERREFESRYRGPVTYREYREMRENTRDPRVARENRDHRDPRETSRDPREASRDPRRDPRNVKDPRLNRDNGKDNNDVREPDAARDPRIKGDFERGRSRNKDDFKFNKFESKFDRMYSRTNREQSRSQPRCRSRSGSDSQEKESFTSPLNSLYTGKEQKVGKGYGIQSFRIPKLKKEVDDKPSADQNTDNSVVKVDSDNEREEQPCIVNGDEEIKGQLGDNSDKQSDMTSSKEKEDSIVEIEESVKDNEEEDGTELEKNETELSPTANEVSTEGSEKTIPQDEESLSEVQEPNASRQDLTAEELVPVAPSLVEPINETSRLEEPEIHEVESAQQSKEPETDLPPTLYPVEGTVQEEHKVLEAKAPAEQTILAQFFANLLTSQDKKEKKTALYSLISTFSDSFSPKELTKITKIIKAEDTDASSEDEGDASKKKEPSVTPEKVEETIREPARESSPEEIPRRTLRRRIRRISSGSPVKETHTEEIEDEEPKPVLEHDLSKSDSSRLEEPVVVSVGERIKSRKRNSSTSSKPKKRNRSELDRLHEDIQDMFIRDGVLTATGKRMCHLLKGDLTALRATSPKEEVEIVPQRRKPGPKSKQQKYFESLQKKEMKDMSVVIQKIPDSAMEDGEKTTRRLTRSMTNADSDSEEDDAVGGEDESERDDSGSSESEKETTAHANEDGQKPKVLKRKRGRSNWASGIIKKKKKKTPAEEPVVQNSGKETASLDSKDFLEPDINYYVDFAKQKSHACKLCSFHGKFITTHYKTAHPDSEVLCSRFTPSVAAEAIADSNQNLSRYEQCTVVRGSLKLKYICRFCTSNSIVFPTFFYDHLSTHTGEYRHICPNCSVSFCNGKTLLSHIKTNHSDDKRSIVRKAYNTSIMFGYLCGECNYVQINKKNVEEHVNIYHLVKPAIYKINLSTFFDDEIENLGSSHVKKDSATELTEESEKKQDDAVEAPVKSKPKPASVKKREAEALKKDEEKKAASSAEAKAAETEADLPPVMVPPKGKKRGPKPGPKSKKKLLENAPEPESDTATDTESVSSKGNVESDKEVRVEKQRRNVLDTQTILPDRSKRAAKEKAQEKLKVIMEMSENGHRKKSSTTEDKNEQIKNQSSAKETEEAVENKDSADDSDNDKGESPLTQTEAAKVIQKKETIEAVKKEVEMNVFTCNTDLQEENRKIEEERLQKMEELNKTVGSRTSLNFVDKLCNRLSNNNIMLKQEPRDDLTDSLFGERSKSPLTMPVLEKNPPISIDKDAQIPLETIIKKPTSPPPQPPTVKKPVLQEDPQPARPSFEVTQKNDKTIVDMIEKLKGKLAPASTETNVDVITVDDEDDGEEPPPLTHVNELVNVKPFDSSTKFLEVGGLVKVIKTSESTTFCCLVPPCIFSSNDKDLFQRHYKDRHSARTFDRENTLCESCGIQIEASSEGSLLENLFKHTITEHADFLTDVEAAAKKPQMIRIRKLSGDALSIVKKDWEEEIDSQVNKESELVKDAEAGVEAATDKAAGTEAGGEASVAEPETSLAEIELTEDNPFPFKISGVMSLAEPPPPLAPLAKQSVQLVVKEAKLTSAELAKPKKTLKAMTKFIEEVSNLYKCPHYYCLFTTSFRDFLEKHLKAHNVEPDSMIPCVYCDMKTPWEHVAMHIDIRHANCRFACSYCLYRAAVKEYVFLHQDRVHPANDYSVIALPTPKIHKKFSAVDIKVDRKILCEPYKCAAYCQLEFLFENEFRKHLMDFHNHSTFMTCGHDDCASRVLTSKLLHHWSSVHSVSSYQCGYCKTSHNDVKMMYHHFSGAHQNMAPDILIRLVNPIPSGNTILGYGAEAFRRMRRIVAIPNTFTDDKNASASTDPTAGQNVTPFTKTTLQMVNAVPPNALPKAIVLPGANNATLNNYALVTTASSIGTSSSGIILLSSNSTVTLAQGGNVVAVSAAMAAPANALTAAPSLSIPQQPPPLAPPLMTPALAPLTDDPTPTSGDVAIAPLEHITLSEETNQEEPCDVEVDPLDLGDPLKTTAAAEGAGYSSEEESDGKSPEKMAKSKMGLLGYQLYRCAFCDFSCSNSNDFKKHSTRSMACRKLNNMARPFECVHCAKCLRTAQALVEHIQSHGVPRYSCSLCMNKFATSLQARSHLKYRHNVNQTSLTPLNPVKSNADTDEYIVKPKMIQSSQAPKEAGPSEPAASTSVEEDVYTPDQISKIPIRSIFSSHKKCGICSYSTKVRTNLLRHLLFHSQEKDVSDTAPVNPVPCLEKNEKMFDKMINLASSSHASSRMGGNAKQDGKESDNNLPEFVSAHYRYACCAQGCSYICPEESNLRHHVMALHGDDVAFACFHCKADIVPSDVDGLMRHLKLHGLQLFKCHYCAFVHHQKNKVEKHVGDGHLDMPVKVVAVRNMSSEPKSHEEPSPGGGGGAPPVTPQPAPAKANVKPWRCCMCKTRSATCDGITSHVLEKHEIDAQYKCALCAYTTDHETTFEGHFKEAHPGHETDYIPAYRKIEDEPAEEGGDAFDTTPLWQRDRPRVRHIRGILFDESSPVPAKNAKKTPTKGSAMGSTKSSSSSLDFSIDAVAKGTAEVLKDDELIDQVNKIMKHSEMAAKSKENDVIVIDDEEENACVSGVKTGLKRKSIEVAGITKIPRLGDIIDLDYGEDEDAYSEKNLKQIFGQFGQPLNRQLRCPLCNNFKSKRMSDFIYHMFKEKKVYRYKCAICADESITYRYMSRHVKEHKHQSDFKDNIIVLHPNSKLEVWVQMLISHQCAKILPSLNPIQEALVEAAKKVECRYCQKWFKSEQEKNEHAIYHWRNVPFACDTCDFKGFTRKQIERHFALMHTSFTLNVLEKGPTVAGEIEYTDKLHMREALQEEEDKNKTNNAEPIVAEAILPESPLPNTVDESNHDDTMEGTVPGTSSDTTFNVSDNKDAYGAADDLVIVTKTDTNVPDENDVFCCEYCPFMSNSETLIMSHISGRHEHMHIKFRMLNRATCESKRSEFVGCMLCPEVGSEISVRRHHLEKHDGQTFITYRYTCNICQKKFMKIAGLKNHSVRTHPSIPVMYTGLFNNVVNLDIQKPLKGRTTAVRTTTEKAETVPEARTPNARSGHKGGHWLSYECPLCPYKKTMQRKQKGNVKLHVKQHFKSFYCGDCPLRFMNNIQALSHYNDKHPGKPKNINHDPSMDEQCIEVWNEIVSRAVRVDGPACPTPPRSLETVQNIAKKSTSSPQRPPHVEEYSYYGLPADEVDLSRIRTSVDINGVCLDMSAEKLGKIFDLQPHVRLVDCQVVEDLEGALS